MAIEMYRISREYVWWKIDTEDDLNTATLEVACVQDPAAQPTELDWAEGDIIDPSHTDGDGSNWWARILIGPETGAIDLSTEPDENYPIDYQSWVRITDAPERPVRKPGVITIL